MVIGIVFKRRIVKSGNSYQIVIPPEIFEGMGLQLGQSLRVEPKENGIFLRIGDDVD